MSDVVDPITGETRFLEFAPSTELYGYLYAAFTFYINADTWISLSGYVQPLDAQPIGAKFWQPVSWGTDPYNPNGKGFDILDPFDRYNTTGQCFGVNS